MKTLALLSAEVAAVLAATFGLNAVALAGGGGGCHGGSTDSTSATVNMKDNCFVSTVVRVPVGETVTWVNQDATLHMVSAMDWVASGGNIAQGQTASVKFERSGVFAYYCPLHAGMVGAVVVGDGSPDADSAGRLVSSGREVPSNLPAQAAVSPAGLVPPDSPGTDWAVLVLGAGLGSVAVVVAGTGGFRLGRGPRSAGDRM